MISLKILVVFCLEYIILNGQDTRDPNRRIDHLERRYKLHSSISSQNFRDLWSYVGQHNEKCCPRDLEQHQTLETGSNNALEVEHLHGKIAVLTKAFSEEKETVREQLESIHMKLDEYNKFCAAEIDKLIKESSQTHDESCTCSSKWIKIYENGPDGEVIFGDRSDLIQAALSGSSVKILANKNYLTTLQNLRPVSGHLMAQALFHISTSGRKFQDDAYWWFVLVSTTGHWFMSRYNVGEHQSRGDNELQYGMQWFIRRPCEMKSAARILPDGTVASGSVMNVVSAVRNGFPIRVTSLKTGYTFPADNLEVHNDHVAAQALWHLSQKYASYNRRLIFQKNAYWYFTIWSTEGKKEMSRWSVGKHESRGKSSDSSFLDWFVDPCWKLVFRHSKEGEIIEGDKNQLIDAIRNGHRVRVVYNVFAFEPNVISIADGNVHALSMDSVSKASFDKFKEDLDWVWRSISTTGTLQTMITPVGSNSNTFTDHKVSMAWFVDKRKWRTQIAKNSNSHKTSKSSVEDLFQYIRNGADVRIQIGNPETDDIFYVQPDNIQLSASDFNVAAMHIRNASFLSTLVPAWIFTYISTIDGGSIDTSIWTLGKHESISHRFKKEHVVWFISE